MRINPVRLILISLVVAIIASIIIYFTFWRPIDSDYDSAKSHAATLQSSTATINELTGAIRTADDINMVLFALNKAHMEYSDALGKLNTSTLTTRDQSVKTAYDKASGPLKQYSQSVNDLLISIKKYVSVVSNCGKLFEAIPKIAKASDFDTKASDCKNDLESAQSLSSTAFANQFFDEYASTVSQLVAAYRTNIVAAESGVQTISLKDASAAEQKITALNERELDLLPTPDPSKQIQSLISILDKQKATVIR